tara:strand:- start:4032 stop:4340 length:309 start_codon:yes stop_codon:yes gene_type:complete
MMRVVKSVSLPVDLAKRAEEFENFSVFVADAIKHGVEENIQHQYAVNEAHIRRIKTYDLMLYEVVNLVKKHGSNKLKIEVDDILLDNIYGTRILNSFLEEDL